MITEADAIRVIRDAGWRFPHSEQVAMDREGRPLVQTMGRDWEANGTTDWTGATRPGGGLTPAIRAKVNSALGTDQCLRFRDRHLRPARYQQAAGAAGSRGADDPGWRVHLAAMFAAEIGGATRFPLVHAADPLALLGR